MSVNRMDINNIIFDLKGIIDECVKYDANKKEVLDTYRFHAIEDEIKRITDDTRAACAKHVNDIQRSLDSLLKSVENGNDYDVNSDAVANAAGLLSKRGISSVAAETVIKKFVGNQVALSLIYASAAEDYKGLIEHWMFDNVGELNKLKTKTELFNYESIENYPGICSSIRQTIEKFARIQGVDMSLVNSSIEELKTNTVCLLSGFNPSIFK